MFGLLAENIDPDKIEKEAVGLAIVYSQNIKKGPYVIFAANEGYNAIYNPGGTKEEGETDFETLKRELKEELNLELSKISKEYITTYAYSPKKNTYFEVRSYVGIVNGTISLNPTEIESALIFKYKDVDENLLRWLNKKYLLGPSVIDCFIMKRQELEKIIASFRP